MTPEDIVEAQEQTGLEPAGEPLPTDNGALDVLLPPETGLIAAGPTAVGQFYPPDERSCDDEALDHVIEALPGVFNGMIACLDEDRKIALDMHVHYADVAKNNAGVDLSTEADSMAREYLTEMVKVDQEKASLTKALAAIAVKRKGLGAKKPKARVGNMVVAGPGSQVNLFGKSRREVIQDLKRKELEEKK